MSTDAPAVPSPAPDALPSRPAGFIGPLPPPRSGLDALFGNFWPEHPRRVPPAPRLLLVGLGLAAGGGIILPGTDFGIGLALTLLAAAAVIAYPLRLRTRAGARAAGGLMALLLATPAVRDAGWAVLLCGLAAYGLGTAALGRSASLPGVIVSTLAIPLAWLRGLPWLRRSLARRHPSGSLWPVVRTAVISGALVVAFGVLFASADAVFASWVEAVTPRVSAVDASQRLIVFGLLLSLVWGGVYVGLNPPRVDRIALGPARAVRRFEWVTPVAGTIAVFLAFLAAQLSALFGGHAYLRATTGLTYAEYVHAGFGQLVAATAAVLLLVAVTLRYAPRSQPADRQLVRLLLGGLCGLALIVVASALYRLGVYSEAYGFTRLRLLVAVFESWLGLVLTLTMTAGVWLRAWWLPKIAVLAGVVMLLGLTLANPDAVVARHNVARFAATGSVDWPYLSRLSADAVPALDALPEPYRSCVLGAHQSDESNVARRASGLSWNLGRARARSVLAVRPVDRTVDCSFPSR